MKKVKMKKVKTLSDLKKSPYVTLVEREYQYGVYDNLDYVWFVYLNTDYMFNTLDTTILTAPTTRQLISEFNNYGVTINKHN